MKNAFQYVVANDGVDKLSSYPFMGKVWSDCLLKRVHKAISHLLSLPTCVANVLSV